MEDRWSKARQSIAQLTCKALSTIYPEYKWLPWRFEKVPMASDLLFLIIVGDHLTILPSI
jgi:hypothetical protein